jgi:hypothetical protein
MPRHWWQERIISSTSGSAKTTDRQASINAADTTHLDFWQSWFTSGTCRMSRVFTRTRKTQTSLR